MNMIVAVDKNWGYGYQNKLLNSIPEDMQKKPEADMAGRSMQKLRQKDFGKLLQVADRRNESLNFLRQEQHIQNRMTLDILMQKQI